MAAVFLALAILFLTAGCSRNGSRGAADEALDLLEEVATALGDRRVDGPESSTSGSGTATVTVSRVVDGDTVEIQPAISGVEDVRLIGVDAPESYGEPDPLGEAAKAFTTRRLEGEKVRLVLGQERFDPYHRLLGYVALPGEPMHQRELLSRGLAQTLFYEPNTVYREKFTALQERARRQDRGIWGLPLSRQCSLENRSNGIGEGSAGC